jgi:hypothetical protein
MTRLQAHAFIATAIIAAAMLILASYFGYTVHKLGGIAAEQSDLIEELTRQNSALESYSDDLSSRLQFAISRAWYNAHCANVDGILRCNCVPGVSYKECPWPKESMQ